MEQIPVYVFTGFLDSGKTKFIQETLEDPRFNDGERTLLLVFEEGEEEYVPSCRGSSPPRDWAGVSYVSFIDSRVLYHCCCC